MQKCLYITLWIMLCAGISIYLSSLEELMAAITEGQDQEVAELLPQIENINA